MYCSRIPGFAVSGVCFFALLVNLSGRALRFAPPPDKSGRGFSYWAVGTAVAAAVIYPHMHLVLYVYYINTSIVVIVSGTLMVITWFVITSHHIYVVVRCKLLV